MLRKKIQVLAISVLLTGGVAQVSLAAVNEVPKVVVQYEDLQLQSDAGVKALYSRLRAASRRVCSAYEGRELHRRGLWTNCYETALNHAVTDLNVTKLTALHQRVRGERAS